MQSLRNIDKYLNTKLRDSMLYGFWLVRVKEEEEEEEEDEQNSLYTNLSTTVLSDRYKAKCSYLLTRLGLLPLANETTPTSGNIEK